MIRTMKVIQGHPNNEDNCRGNVDELPFRAVVILPEMKKSVGLMLAGNNEKDQGFPDGEGNRSF